MTWYALIKERIHPVLKNTETQKELKRLQGKFQGFGGVTRKTQVRREERYKRKKEQLD